MQITGYNRNQIAQSQNLRNNEKQVSFGMKIYLEHDAARILANLPENNAQKIAKLFRRLEGVGKKQEVVMEEEKRFFGLLGSKKVPTTVVKQPVFELEMGDADSIKAKMDIIPSKSLVDSNNACYENNPNSIMPFFLEEKPTGEQEFDKNKFKKALSVNPVRTIINVMRANIKDALLEQNSGTIRNEISKAKQKAQRGYASLKEMSKLGYDDERAVSKKARKELADSIKTAKLNSQNLDEKAETLFGKHIVETDDYSNYNNYLNDINKNYEY